MIESIEENIPLLSNLIQHTIQQLPSRREIERGSNEETQLAQEIDGLFADRDVAMQAGMVQIPFLEGRNSLDLVLEFVATTEKPAEFCDESSLLVLTLIEFCFGLEPTKRNELIASFYRHLVLGIDVAGKQLENYPPLELMGWTPPNGWVGQVLVKSLASEGECQSIGVLEIDTDADSSVIADEINTFIAEIRSSRPTELPAELPASVIILACLKHRSPLPPEFWRGSIFPSVEKQSESDVKES